MSELPPATGISISVDKLRTEFSPLNPQQENEYKELSHRIADVYIKMWGEFMPEATKAKIQRVKERVLVLDEETFPLFATHTDYVNESEVQPESFSNQEFAQSVLTEACADYYANEVLYILGLEDKYAEYKANIGILLFYKLREEFGDELHRVYFGTADSEITNQVLKKVKEYETNHLPEVYETRQEGDEEQLVSLYSQVAGYADRESEMIVLKQKDRSDYFPNSFRLKTLFKNWFIGKWAKQELNYIVNARRIAHEMAHVIEADALSGY